MTHQMLVEPGETVVLLPAATRYEQEGGGTSTTTERRVAFSPEIPGPRVGEARSEWQIFADVARRVRPELAADVRLRDGRRDPRRDRARRAELRRDRAICARPATRSRSAARGCARAACSRRPTARRTSSRGRAARRRRPRRSVRPLDPAGQAVQLDGVAGAAIRSPARGRDALLPRRRRRRRALGVADGDAVLVRSAHGEMRARVHLAPIRPGNVQAFFPEANLLLSPTAPRADLGRARLQRGRRSGAGPMTHPRRCSTASTKSRVAVREALAPVDADHAPRAHERRRSVRARPRRRRGRARRAAEAAGAHRERGVGRARATPVRRSRSCSIRSTARPTARAASPTGRSRSARSMPTARSRRSSSIRRPASGRRRSAARARSATASCCRRRTSRGSKTP